MDKEKLMHIGAEVVVIAGVSFYLNKKCNDTNKKIEDLSNKIENIENALTLFDDKLKQILSLLNIHDDVLSKLHTLPNNVPHTHTHTVPQTVPNNVPPRSGERSDNIPPRSDQPLQNNDPFGALNEKVDIETPEDALDSELEEEFRDLCEENQFKQTSVNNINKSDETRTKVEVLDDE